MATIETFPDEAADDRWASFEADVSALVPRGGPAVTAVSLLDLELRTAVASLVSAAGVVGALRPGRGTADRQASEFWAEAAERATVADLFPAPPPVHVRKRTLARLRWAPTVTDVDSLSFVSPHRAFYPALRGRYESHPRNMIGRALHWRHDDGPRPTIIVLHGFTGSPYWFNSTFFQLQWFYRHGLDVVLAVLPFHGRRNDPTGPFDGSGLFTDGVATTNEAMLQSVTDVRVLVDYLLSTGVDRVGVTGLSLGGYVTALSAVAESRLHFAIPNSAVVDMGGLMETWFPASQLLRVGRRLAGVDRETSLAAMRAHSPLRFPPALPKDRLMVVAGLADRLAPPPQSARLWLHWDQPSIQWFPGSHILHRGRAVYLREIGRFLRQSGFSPG